MKTILSILALTGLPSFADLQIPQIFSDGMVLQQETSSPVWGWADAQAEIQVTFAGQSHSTTADEGGNWKINLTGLSSNEQGSELSITSGSEKKVIQNVVVGEVWIASGQSNMEWRMPKSTGGTAEIANAHDPLLRVFVATNIAKPSPQKDLDGKWKATEAANTASFTAVGYYFAKRLRAELKVPIGIIECAWGGKPVEAFTSAEALAKLPIGKNLLDSKAKAAAAFDSEKAMARYQIQLAAHKEKIAAWKNKPDADKGKEPRRPRKPLHPSKNPKMPSTVYQGMIAPIVGYGNRGAIWYQGEANAYGGTAGQYEELLGCMVADWRARWGHDFSFYWAQLANFRKPTTQPGEESEWVIVQDEMRRALKSIHKSGMAVINDIGAANDIHPQNKHDVGERLARWALAKDYGRKDIIISGPLYSGMRKEGQTLTLSFDHAAGLKARDGKELQRFEIAGADGTWYWAKATIVGQSITLTHDSIPEPVKARYAWASNPEGANLVNGAGLPASCFTSE